MNGLQFASSLISSLVWPMVALVLVAVFRKPLADLIGRIKSYKGLGQELTFGDRLADAENSVEEAARSSPIDKGESEQIESKPSPLTREAEANPSFVIIRSWELVASALSDLVGATIVMHGNRSAVFSAALLEPLQRAGFVSTETAVAVRELRELRNKVAHGQHNPTPGEAVAYAEAAQRLSTIMEATAGIAARSHDSASSYALQKPEAG